MARSAPTKHPSKQTEKGSQETVTQGLGSVRVLFTPQPDPSGLQKGRGDPEWVATTPPKPRVQGLGV